MRRAVAVALILMAYILGGIAILGNYSDTAVYPAKTQMQTGEATLFVNESGVFVKVPLSFKDGMWVDGIIITPDTWLVEAYKVRVLEGYDPKGFIDFIIRDYSDRMIPVRKELGGGVYVFNVTGYVQTEKTAYPVWRGKVVVGDKTVKLDSLGKVIPASAKKVISTTVIVKVIYAYTVDIMPTVLSGINYDALEKKAYVLFHENKTRALIEFAKEITRDIINGIKNGTVIIGYYGRPFSKDFAAKLISSGRLWITVTIDVGETVVNATVVVGGVPKYDIAIFRHMHITVDSRTMKPEADYREEVELMPTMPEPTIRSGAVIVVYRETPYSPYKVLVLPLKAETLGNVLAGNE